MLILSTLAGAARELTNALQVNPYDTGGVSSAIRVALSMTLSERRQRHKALLEVIRRNDIHAWHGKFVAALEEAGAGGRRRRSRS